jgi:hypothetical protein
MPVPRTHARAHTHACTHAHTRAHTRTQVRTHARTHTGIDRSLGRCHLARQGARSRDASGHGFALGTVLRTRRGVGAAVIAAGAPSSPCVATCCAPPYPQCCGMVCCVALCWCRRIRRMAVPVRPLRPSRARGSCRRKRAPSRPLRGSAHGLRTPLRLPRRARTPTHTPAGTTASPGPDAAPIRIDSRFRFRCSRESEPAQLRAPLSVCGVPVPIQSPSPFPSPTASGLAAESSHCLPWAPAPLTVGPCVRQSRPSASARVASGTGSLVRCKSGTPSSASHNAQRTPTMLIYHTFCGGTRPPATAAQCLSTARSVVPRLGR